MTAEEFITNKLNEFRSAIPYDIFSDLATSVAHNYELSLDDATKLIHTLRKEKQVGSQEFTTHSIGRDELWPGQDQAVNFGGNQPGHLYEPRSWKVNDRVRIPSSTWASSSNGIIEHINEDNTVDVREESTNTILESVPLDSLGIPFAVGRNDVRDQRRRVGDPFGLMDGPLPVGGEEIRDRTSPWMPKGQEGKDVKNPESLFYKEAETPQKLDVLYSVLIDSITKECGKVVASDVKEFLDGKKEPTRELQSVLRRYNLSRLL